MSLALVRKEAREHGWVLAAVVVFLGLSLAGMLDDASDQGGRFTALVRFTGVFGTLTAVIASNRLFAREYSGRTQLFLEVLPVTRARVLATKWLLGAAFQSAIVTASWWATLTAMRRTEVITGSDALRPLVATLAFALAAWSFGAMAGMLGRYRYVAWLVLFLLYVYLDQMAKLPLRATPVLRLLDQTTAMARTPVEPGALLEALAVVLGCATVTAVLGLAGSGALAATLARRMTARERVFVIAALVVGMVVGSSLEKKHELPPFDLAEATRSPSARGVVGVLRTEDMDDAKARTLGDAVARDVDGFASALHLASQPPVFLLPQRGLDPAVTQRAALANADGIVLRAAPDAEAEVVRRSVLHALLVDATKHRGLKEDRHVVLDGVTAWWIARGDDAAQARWWRRAAVSPLPLSRTLVTRWNETSEQLGDCVAGGLAFAVFDELVRRVGEARALALTAKLFAEREADVRALLFEERPEALLAAEGLSWDALTAAAEARRVAIREADAGAWTARPSARATIALERTADGNTVTVHVEGVERWRVLYEKLGPWARGRSDLPRLDVRGADATLPVALASGERLLAEVDTDDDYAGCAVRLAATRLEVP